MSYPPTPDPFSIPSSRSIPSNLRKSQPQSSSSYRDNRDDSEDEPTPPNSSQFPGSSSADNYGSTDAYSRFPNQEDDDTRSFHSFAAPSHQDTLNSERSPMIPSNHHPLFASSGNLNPDTIDHDSRPFSRAADTYDHSNSSNSPRDSMLTSKELLGSNYGGPAYRINSRDISSASMQSIDNESDRDDDSHRGLYTGAGSGGDAHESPEHARGHTRRGSNLAYSYYDDGNEGNNEKYPSGGLAGVSVGRDDAEMMRINDGLRPRVEKTSRWSKMSSKAKKWIIFGVLAIFILIAIVAGVTVSMMQRSQSAASASSNDRIAPLPTNNANPTATVATRSNIITTTRVAPSAVPTQDPVINWRTAAVGAHGSTIYAANNDTFIYNNTFGGFWNAIPFNDSAQVASDVPPLNVPWNYNTGRIMGVNVGGWFVIEPFIVPALFEPYSSGDGGWGTPATVVDEWTLCVALGSNMAATIENHYATFITERDFAEIAAAGLNWVRIPIGFWMMEVYPGEPFLANVGWAYFLQALAWARKYGLRVNLDLHSVPGSQNGFNHSSKFGTINFLNGVMGIANAQRTLNYIRTLTEFISQDQYKNLVPMFGIMNEPLVGVIATESIRSFYVEVYEMIRGITGIGAGRGPMIVFADGFALQATSMEEGGWLGFMAGADRIQLDTHPYLCFGPPSNDGITYNAAKTCSYWAENSNTTRQQFGTYNSGEWSLAINDCGKWINNVGNGARFDGSYRVPGTTNPQFDAVGSCSMWNDYPNWSAATRAGLTLVAEGSMDALGDNFFWTWKTGVSSFTGAVTAPLWNYQLLLAQGVMPLDPRIAIGTCPSIVAATDLTLVNNPFVGPYSAWQTGGSATVSPIAAAGIAAYTQWPPASLGPTPAEFLPTYTPTQAPITQRAASPTSFPAGYSTVLSMNNGWFNPRDTEPYNTPIQGCNYPNAYSGLSATIPRTHCPPRAPGAAPAAPTIVPARDAAVTTTTPELIATTRFPVITADAPRTTAASPTPVRTATT